LVSLTEKKENTMSKIKTKKQFILYYKPILFLIITISLTTYFYINQLHYAKQQIIYSADREAKTITETLKGIIQSQTKRGRIAKGKLKQILDNVIKNTDLKYICIVNRGKVIFRTSDPSIKRQIFERKNRCKKLTDGCYFYSDTIHSIHKKITQLKQKNRRTNNDRGMRYQKFSSPHENYKITSEFNHKINKPDHRSNEIIDFGGKYQGIDIVFNGLPYIKRLQTETGKLLIAYISTCIALLVLTAAWIYLIKNSKLKFEYSQLKAKSNRLEELNLSAAGLAHELKNPLGIIRGIAQRLQNLNSSSNNLEIDKYSCNIIDEIDRATERLNYFLNFAKIKTPNLANLRAVDFISEIIDIFSSDSITSKMKLESEIDDILIEADKEFLNQILVNLLLNSFKACTKNCTIKVTLKQHNNFAELSVIDDGSGINKSLIGNIFKPYISGFSNGHGIGLAVVNRLVEESNWRIYVKSELNSGTEMKINNIKIVNKL